MRAAVLLTGVVVAVGLSACESTQDKAARLRREGAQSIARQKGLEIAERNPDVKVLGKTLVHDANGTAAIVELRNVGPAEAQVPIAIRLDDAKGNKVFANDAPGLAPALVAAPLLQRKRVTYWVHNQIITAKVPKKLEVTVGKGKQAGIPAKPPHITLSDVRLDHDSDGSFAAGIVHNRSTVVQKHLTIFCVARRNGKIVAAGRAEIEKLPVGKTPKPIRFTVYFIGDPRGASLEFSVPPVNLR